MRRRRTAFGRELERNDTAYALVYGANRSGSAVSWLTGWPVTREALLVVAPEPADDVLLVSFFNHVPQARRLSAAQTGELLLVTDHGPQRLHAYPPGLAQLG
jgi:Xaa-Pro dipeptidase